MITVVQPGAAATIQDCIHINNTNKKNPTDSLTCLNINLHSTKVSLSRENPKYVCLLSLHPQSQSSSCQIHSLMTTTTTMVAVMMTVMGMTMLMDLLVLHRASKHRQLLLIGIIRRQQKPNWPLLPLLQILSCYNDSLPCSRDTQQQQRRLCQTGGQTYYSPDAPSPALFQHCCFLRRELQTSSGRESGMSPRLTSASSKGGSEAAAGAAAAAAGAAAASALGPDGAAGAASAASGGCWGWLPRDDAGPVVLVAEGRGSEGTAAFGSPEPTASAAAAAAAEGAAAGGEAAEEAAGGAAEAAAEGAPSFSG